MSGKDRLSVILRLLSAATTNTQEANWLMTVASAAPVIPMSNTNMNSGSSAMFRAAPSMTPIIADALFPCAVRKVLSPTASCTNSVPMR